MSLGYRTILTARATKQNIQDITATFQNWVISYKGFPHLPRKGTVEHEQKSSTLTGAEFRDKVSSISAQRWTLTEIWSPPPWYKNEKNLPQIGITKFTLAHDVDRAKIWLWMDVEPPTIEWKNSRTGRWVREVQQSGRPRVIKEILDNVEMHDGRSAPSSDFQIIATPNHVNELYLSLSDSTRVGAIFVTAPPEGRNTIKWARISEKYAGQIQGMATGYVLTPEARSEFNSRYASPEHAIPSGGIRTFLPGAILGNPKDAINHRLLHPSTLETSDERRISRILRNAQVQRLSRLRIPDVLREVDYGLLKAEKLQPFVGLHKPVQSSDVRTHREEAKLWKELAEQVEDTLSQTIDENHSVKERLANAEELAELLQLENDDQYEELARLRNQEGSLQRRIQYLERELSKLGDDGASAAFSWVDDKAIDYPNTFEELVKRAKSPELPGVGFTADTETAYELDEHPSLGTAIVMKTWDALLTFNNYVIARNNKDFDQSLSHFCQHGPKLGFEVRIPNIIWTEGENVQNNPELRSQRVFPVSTEVDPSGEALMLPHARLSNATGIAPRMYFDDTYSKIQVVTVGYLGRHLDN